MPIDPRIAMGLQVPDIVGSLQQGMNWHDQRQQQSQLRDLLPQAAQGDQQAMNELWGVDPNMAMKMDQRQREQAAAMTEDLSSAVRWADTPEKWGYVQQHYGQKGVDLSPYKFEDRERGLMTLDKLSGYLKGDGQPTSMQRNYEFLKGQDPALADQYLRGQAEGPPIVQRNEDGTLSIYPRSVLNGGGQQQSGPKPGQVEEGYRFKGGNPADPNNWIKVNGGSTPQASSGFPSSGY